MRVIADKVEIDDKKTKDFFSRRGGKYNEKNPYSLTMYQDNHPELVRERNKHEVQILKPLLQLDSHSRVLDFACGIGRWADAITEDIEEYCGIDYSGEFVRIARERNKKENFSFYEGAAWDVDKVLEEHQKGNFNKIIIVGLVMYINDSDIRNVLKKLCTVCAENTTICIREPIGIEERLTLKDFYSEELRDDYNAIYRTRDELMEIFEDTLFENGFSVEQEGYLFEEPELNNRKETSQYYFILKR